MSATWKRVCKVYSGYSVRKFRLCLILKYRQQWIARTEIQEHLSQVVSAFTSEITYISNDKAYSEY